MDSNKLWRRANKRNNMGKNKSNRKNAINNTNNNTSVIAIKWVQIKSKVESEKRVGIVVL
jgi:hypothetical protein